jgi:hypothetical protein
VWELSVRFVGELILRSLSAEKLMKIKSEKKEVAAGDDGVPEVSQKETPNTTVDGENKAAASDAAEEEGEETKGKLGSTKEGETTDKKAAEEAITIHTKDPADGVQPETTPANVPILPAPPVDKLSTPKKVAAPEPTTPTARTPKSASFGAEEPATPDNATPAKSSTPSKPLTPASEKTPPSKPVTPAVEASASPAAPKTPAPNPDPANNPEAQSKPSNYVEVKKKKASRCTIS